MTTVAAVLNALALPVAAQVDQRVPKKLLLEHGAPTAADKRRIQESIEELHWLASLKPANCAIPAWRDEMREYLEIAVLAVTLRQVTGETRLLTLIHRAVPYPVVLLTSREETLSLSLVHKRFSQGEAGRMVLDGELLSVELSAGSAVAGAFLASLDFQGQSANNLFLLYQGWMARVEALLAGRITGRFEVPETEQQVEARRAALAHYTRVAQAVAELRVQAAREKQINRLVALNMQVKQMEEQLGRIAHTL